MPTGKLSNGKSYARKPYIQWTEDMVLYVCTAWKEQSTEQIAEYLSKKYKLSLTRDNVNHIVNVLRQKGVDIPRKHKVGVYQVLVEGFLSQHPEFKKKGGK